MAGSLSKKKKLAVVEIVGNKLKKKNWQVVEIVGNKLKLERNWKEKKLVGWPLEMQAFEKAGNGWIWRKTNDGWKSNNKKRLKNNILIRW